MNNAPKKPRDAGRAVNQLPPAAVRALEEAAMRRKANPVVAKPGQTGGPSGVEPTRYGDWERKGRAVDF